jgi:hypothetical protein
MSDKGRVLQHLLISFLLFTKITTQLTKAYRLGAPDLVDVEVECCHGSTVALSPILGCRTRQA